MFSVDNTLQDVKRTCFTHSIVVPCQPAPSLLHSMHLMHTVALRLHLLSLLRSIPYAVTPALMHVAHSVALLDTRCSPTLSPLHSMRLNGPKLPSLQSNNLCMEGRHRCRDMLNVGRPAQLLTGRNGEVQPYPVVRPTILNP